VDLARPIAMFTGHVETPRVLGTKARPRRTGRMPIAPGSRRRA